MNAEIWTVCNSCNKRVTGDSIHTCSPQVKQLSDEEMELIYYKCFNLKNKMPDNEKRQSYFKFARAIIKEITE